MLAWTASRRRTRTATGPRRPSPAPRSAAYRRRRHGHRVRALTAVGRRLECRRARRARHPGRPDAGRRRVRRPTPAARSAAPYRSPACADAWAEATVAGANAAGETLVICGTTLIVWCSLADRSGAAGCGRCRTRSASSRWSPARATPAGCSSNGSSARSAPSTDVPTPGDVPIWVPYLRGERSPLNDPTLRASLHERRPRSRTRRDHASRVRGDRLRRPANHRDRPVRRRPASWRAAGARTTRTGSRRSPTATGLPVDVVAVPEGAALGAAWNARVGAGLDVMTDATRWAKVGRRHEPRADWVEACEDRYERWLTLAG